MEKWGVHLTKMVYCCDCVAMATLIGMRQRFIVGKAEERDSQLFIRKLQQFHVWLRVTVTSHIVISHLLSPSLLISAAGMKCQMFLLVFTKEAATELRAMWGHRTVVILPQENYPQHARSCRISKRYCPLGLSRHHALTQTDGLDHSFQTAVFYFSRRTSAQSLNKPPFATGNTSLTVKTFLKSTTEKQKGSEKEKVGSWKDIVSFLIPTDVSDWSAAATA